MVAWATATRNTLATTTPTISEVVIATTTAKRAAATIAIRHVHRGHVGAGAASSMCRQQQLHMTVRHRHGVPLYR